MNALKILLVDDSKNMRKIVKRYIQIQYPDAEFQEAENGAKAEALLQESQVAESPFHIVILDWMMPKVSGFEFLKKIRSVELFKSEPRIIMLTAETYSEQLNAAMKYNVSAYITKPFTSDDLNQAIESILSEIAEGDFSHAV